MSEPVRPHHSRPAADAIASLFEVPDELADELASVTEQQARDRMRRRGISVDAAASAQELAARLARAEFGGVADGELTPVELAGLTRRHGELVRELMRRGTPEAYAVFRVRLDIARERRRTARARAAVEASQRRAHTDPVTGRFDLDVHGPVDVRSIIPARAGEVGAAWHQLHSSALVHHLASARFAALALERNPELKAAVDAEVQRMLDEAGL
ncbi:hypothetical protein [Microbacterium sp.]|uniref:hypothetical protein n=1 Tax=Microbacterium sp. TaxID=51671 RepID=UPI0039E369AF